MRPAAIHRWLFIAIFALAVAVRSVGLFRGLETGASFHPDVAKQMVAVQNYLRGIYVWYVGSLAYDGYPYGLNHVDEWLIRATWPTVRYLVSTLQPAVELPNRPSQSHIHHIALLFRVLYGIIALAVFWGILQRLDLSPALRLLWLLAAALSPILSVVTHTATGDVGTDLFAIAAIALFLRARNTDPSPLLFFACGAMCGLAFACKYHGLLAILAPGFWLLLAPLSWKRRFAWGAALAGGAIAGFVLLTPHVLWKTEKTLELIWLNFHYIRNYGVSSDFLALPFGSRLRISLSSNVPIVLHTIGYSMVTLSVLAAIAAARKYLQNRSIESAWNLSAIAAPWVAIVLALIGKPEVQPFHFSFLPLMLMAASAATAASSRFPFRACSAILLAFAAVEYARIQRWEWFHWSREDTLSIVERAEDQLAISLDPSERVTAVGFLAVESENLSVFRNRPRVVRVPGGSVWTNAPQAFLPSTPWPISRHWIFADLPAFPRETRLAVIKPREPFRRGVVQSELSGDLSVLVCAGPREAFVDLRVDGERQSFLLPAYESRSWTFPREKARPFQRGPYAGRAFDVQIDVRGSPILVRFGPPPEPLVESQIISAKLARARFFSGTNTVGSGAFGLLRFAALTPGRYAVELNAPTENTPTLIVNNLLVKHPDRAIRVPFEQTNGVWLAEWTNTPQSLFSSIEVDCGSNAAPITIAWNIRPLEALEPVAPAPPPWQPQFSFAKGRWTLGNLYLPPRLPARASFAIEPRLKASPKGLEDLDEVAFFIHLLDSEKRQVYAQDIPLERIPSRYDGALLAQMIGPLDLPPGRYEAWIGLYHPRTGKRVKPDAPHGRDRRVHAGSIELY
ncbi:MAG: glycosyltransferase family 39 protein [Kiritimatiellae bacterium]|nr:glycosyltransferase family 39 protein [Kiritimatiellia bacterium]MDW8458131.1 hypothetical protein [Verrucomicrobiota bacterium]